MHTNYIRLFINCMCEVQVLITVTAASKVTTWPHLFTPILPHMTLAVTLRVLLLDCIK